MDIMVKDSLGRERQISTIQLDFIMPQRFKLTYKDSDGQEKTPVMIHRAIIGSPERFMGILIEHYA
jgi:threonyl-tRNA synthetase